MTTVNPEMIVLARESRGWGQAELAERMRVSQGFVSRIEAGLREFPADRIEELCRVLGYPTEFFTVKERVHGYGSPCLYHRKKQSVTVGALRQAQAVANVTRVEVEGLLRGVEIDARWQFFQVDVQEVGSPERVAEMVRRTWRLPLGPVRNLVRVIESAGGVVVRRSFGTRKVDAISQWPPGRGPLFVVNSDLPWDRVRFTLAHEIGHMVMHGEPSTTQEDEANRFASEFLMPASEVYDDLSTDELTLPRLSRLKQVWRVSMQALIRRAKDLGIISVHQYYRLMKKLSAMGYRVAEPNAIAPEEPSVLADAVNVHRNQHRYTVEELSRLARLSQAEFVAKYLRNESGGHLRIVPAQGSGYLESHNSDGRWP